jgi:SAM-dependent methyltransferase
MNLITAATTREEHLKQYRDYPVTFEGGLDEKPYYESRILPIFYEVPLGAKVLDVGCNDGTFMAMLRDKRQCNVTGVDLSETALEAARAKNLPVHLTDGETLPFPDATFDVVTLMEVIAHVLNPVKALEEIKRVLRPGGILLGSTPHKNLEQHIWSDKRLHRRYYDQPELTRDLESVFPVSHIRVLKGGQFSLAMAQNLMAEQPAEMLFKCGDLGTLGWDAALRDRSVLRVWFGMTQTPGTAYYRMSGFCDKMQKKGAQTFYEPYDPRDQSSCGDWQRKVRWKHVQNEFDHILKAADMSVWQITHSWDVLAFFRCIKDLFKKPFVTEIDDWFFDIPPYNIASAPYQPNSDKEKIAWKQLEISDAVVCSTEFIKEKMREFFPDKPVFVIRNSLDFGIWDSAPIDPLILPKKEGAIRIGYTGCGNHHGDLEMIVKPMLALLEEFPALEFIYPLQRDLDGEDKNVRLAEKLKHERIFCYLDWAPLPDYPKMVKSWNLDIGIAPLRDNNFNRAKSNLRWLEYSAMGIPTVASAVYPFKNSIRNKKDGIVVNNGANHWYEALWDLITDNEKRQKIGQRAYERVKRDFNMESVALEYRDLLEEIKHATFRSTGGNRPALVRSQQ